MKKVLLLGFSVAGGKFYKCAQNAEIPGIQVDVFGLGAHHYVHVPDYLDTVTTRDSYDMVMVDLVSSQCRKFVTRRSFTNALKVILAKIAAHNIRIGFTYFHRDDAPLDTDILRVVSNRFARRFNIPVIDLGALVPGIAPEMDRYFSDGVHFTPMGAQWAFDHWAARLQDADMWTGRQNFRRLDPPAKQMDRLSIPPHQAGLTAEEVLFEGYGVRWPMMVFGENQTATLEIPPGITASGFFLVKGPASGDVEVTIEGEAPRVIHVFDGKSYYDRMAWYGLKMGGARRVQVRQLPGVPRVKLDKGTAYLGPREMKLSLITGRKQS